MPSSRSGLAVKEIENIHIVDKPEIMVRFRRNVHGQPVPKRYGHMLSDVKPAVNEMET
jgi:hypothetical protein